MASKNGKIPGTFVSDKELNDLSDLLKVYKDHLVSHETRIGILEAWVVNFMEAADAFGETSQDGIDSSSSEEAASEAPAESVEDAS